MIALNLKILSQESSSFTEKIFLLDNMVLDHIQVVFRILKNSDRSSPQPSYEEALNNIIINNPEEVVRGGSEDTS